MNTLLQTSSRIHGLFVRGLEYAQSPFLLAVRLIWGFQFAQTGWGKWQDIGKVTEFFTGLGIPAPHLNAYVVATTELCGGILLLLGLGSRLAALPLIFAMIVAYVTTEQEALGKLLAGNPDDFFAAAPFLFFFASLIVLVFGPGTLSLDYLIGKHLNKTRSAGRPGGA